MVRSKRARTWWIGLAAVIVLAVLFVPTMQLLFMRFPELFGNHDFYVQCKALKAGSSLAKVRQDMARYLEVGRTWSPPETLSPLFSGTVLGSAETQKEHETRSVFVPNSRDVADWCIVYHRGGVVARVELAPD